MFDAGLQSDLQRARGRAEVGFHCPDGPVRLKHLHQSGCAKILLPATYGPVPEAVIINTSGGITGGDRLAYSAEVAAGAAATVTTQAAERVYRASGGEGRIDTQLTLGADAALDWLPQETILFEGGRLARRLNVDMAETATALILEAVILGRAAMGETLDDASLTDHWRITKGGRLCYADALRLAPPLRDTTGGRATLNGARAFATLVYVAPDAEDRLDATHALLDFPGVTAAASAWNGALVIRFLAGHAQHLRAALIPFLTQFRARPLPRVWQM